MTDDTKKEIYRGFRRGIGVERLARRYCRTKASIYRIIGEMRAVTAAPLVAYPNAGLPITEGDRVRYELGPEAMAKEYPALLDAGANIVGACCGSNPELIRLIAEVVRNRARR